MKRIRRLLLPAVIPSVIMGTIVGGALSAPALAGTGARPLTLTSVQLQFTSFACLNDSCSVNGIGAVDISGQACLRTAQDDETNDVRGPEADQALIQLINLAARLPPTYGLRKAWPIAPESCTVSRRGT
jgi:hypothetical protein